jgi:valyl-tRNA synthetase
MKLDPKKKVPAQFFSEDNGTRRVLEANTDGIARLATLSELTLHSDKLPQGGAARSSAQFDIRIPYAAETIDIAAERIRVAKEMDGLQKAIASKENQLANETFRSRAPEKIIRQMEEALNGQRVELQKLSDRFEQLGAG